MTRPRLVLAVPIVAAIALLALWTQIWVPSTVMLDLLRTHPSELSSVGRTFWLTVEANSHIPGFGSVTNSGFVFAMFALTAAIGLAGGAARAVHVGCAGLLTVAAFSAATALVFGEPLAAASTAIALLVAAVSAARLRTINPPAEALPRKRF